MSVEFQNIHSYVRLTLIKENKASELTRLTFKSENLYISQATFSPTLPTASNKTAYFHRLTKQSAIA